MYRSTYTLLLYLSRFFLLSTCNEVKIFETTFTCNEVHLGGNFRNVTKYQYLRFKMLKVIHFSAVHCDLCFYWHTRFYSLLQIIVASPAKLCSIKVAANL